MLNLEIRSRLGAFALEASLSVPDRSVLVLVGETGSGKSTLLRMIAGLRRPDLGSIEVDGSRWFDHETDTWIPAASRPVGFVPQDYALFPHLTAVRNVAFGLRAQGIPAWEAAIRADVALERLGVRELAGRRPHELSGGQQQRVAIARAIVLEPRVLLLDEPLSALDVATRRTVRGELRRLLAELPCVTMYVTHSPIEALALGERIAVLEAGRIAQCGSREDLMRRPRSAYAAEFLGVNFLRGTIAGREDGGLARVTLPQGEILIPDPGTGGEVAVIVRPREITLTLERPTGSARNLFQGAIEDLVPEPPAGDLVRVALATRPPLIAEVTRQSVEALGLAPGKTVHASFKAAGIEVVP